MKIKFFSKMINEQLGFLLPKILLADLLLFIAALPFYGLTVSVPAGLLLGTAASLANFILIGYSAERAVEKGSAKAAKRYMFSFYLIRLAIMGAAIYAGFVCEFPDPVCVFIPLLYPKLFYSGSAVISEIKNKKGG
ncbi:MAG: ATP synthase subunit I [Oscillospiraceae bacterium]|nr:ATP synthase subunit I [Oscillospiraceae bacterium]